MSDLDQIQKALQLREDAVRQLEAQARKERIKLDDDKRAFGRMLAIRDGLSTVDHVRNTTLVALKSNLTEFEKTLDLDKKEIAVGGYGFFKNSTRAAIAAMPALFTSSDVAKWLPGNGVEVTDGNRSNISAYLSEFEKAGLIEIETKGAGRRPTVYRHKK